MGKAKVLTPQERYRERKEREAAEQSSHLPPGLINHGNTCFMNSVLQGLTALPYLQQMIIMQLPESRRSPALTNGRGGEFELEWTEGLKLSDTFIMLMTKVWNIKDTKQRISVSPKELLTTLGQKYPQYNDFRQQDAHEFLRFLLDGMRMEEFDIIKKRQPPIPKSKKGKQKEIFGQEQNSEGVPIPPEKRLIPFVDAIFTGQLASILICQACKHVSITKEPFDDLSLSVKPEDRKRHRLRAFAHKLMNKEKTESAPRPVSAPPTRPTTPFGSFGVLSASPRRRSLEKEPEPESPFESTQLKSHSLEPSLQQETAGRQDSSDSFGAKLGRRVSVNWKNMKESKKVSGKYSAHHEPPHAEVLNFGPMTSSPLPSPKLHARPGPEPSTSPAIPDNQKEKISQKLSPRAQSAYVKSLLSDHSSSKPLNPFAYLPSGSSFAKLAPEQGLEQALRQFTSVELLEKENMYGCRRCWKIANGLAVLPDDHEPEEEDGEEERNDEESKPSDQVRSSNLAKREGNRSLSSLSPTTDPVMPNQDLNISALNLASSTGMVPLTDTPITPTLTRELSIPLITTEPPNSPSTELNVGHSHEASNDSSSIGHNGTSTAASSTSFLSPRPQLARVHFQRRLGSHHTDDDSVSGLSSDESSDDGLSDTSIATSFSNSGSGSESDPQSTEAEKEKAAKAALAREVRARRAKEIILRKAYKRYLIAKPPPILVIHLKRFQQISKTPSTIFGNLKKMDEYIPFPEYLDLSGYLAPRRRDFGEEGKMLRESSMVGGACMYRLVAVMVHIGNMLGGHYIAYTALPPDEDTSSLSEGPLAMACENPATNSQPQPSSQTQSTSSSQSYQSKTASTPITALPPSSISSTKFSSKHRKWCYISDTVVRLVPLEEVLKSKAYICMYERMNVDSSSATSNFTSDELGSNSKL